MPFPDPHLLRNKLNKLHLALTDDFQRHRRESPGAPGALDEVRDGLRRRDRRLLDRAVKQMIAGDPQAAVDLSMRASDHFSGRQIRGGLDSVIVYLVRNAVREHRYTSADQLATFASTDDAKTNILAARDGEAFFQAVQATEAGSVADGIAVIDEACRKSNDYLLVRGGLDVFVLDEVLQAAENEDFEQAVELAGLASGPANQQLIREAIDTVLLERMKFVTGHDSRQQIINLSRYASSDKARGEMLSHFGVTPSKLTGIERHEQLVALVENGGSKFDLLVNAATHTGRTLLQRYGEPTITELDNMLNDIELNDMANATKTSLEDIAVSAKDILNGNAHAATFSDAGKLVIHLQRIRSTLADQMLSGPSHSRDFGSGPSLGM